MNLAMTTDIQKYSLLEFKETFKQYIKTLSSAKNRLELKAILSEDFSSFTESFIASGDAAYELSDNSYETYTINYILSEEFKTLMLLHRDVFLELNKVSVYIEENQLLDSQIEKHFEESKEVLLKVLNNFQDKTLSKEGDLNDEKIKRKLSLQKNPWDIYKSQFEIILDQIKDIADKKIVSFSSIEIFNNLKEVLNDLTNKQINLIDKISVDVDTILNQINENKDFSDLLVYTDARLNEQHYVENKNQSFTDAVNSLINQLQKIEIPVSSAGGQLNVRDIDIKKRAQKWFDYQILPEFMDLIGLETSLINKYNLNLINLKNSLQLSKNNDAVGNLDTLKNAISLLQDEIKAIKTKSLTASNSLKAKMDSELLISNIIKEKPFLDVTLNYSLGIESYAFLKSIASVLQKSNTYFNSQYKKSLSHNALTNLEISTQCMAHRMFTQESTHYDSLFMSKNFIGDLFLVPRKKSEEKLKTIIEQWHGGFNKAVLIVGERLSGRSTFLDYTSKKFFGKNIVSLKPNSNSTIDGRKFSTTYDLKEALSYVKNNNAKNTKPIILIDDLELWRDNEHSLLTNVRALINFIETESDDTFVMVATTEFLHDHLNQRLNFSKTFGHTINISEAESQEITEAILLRHGAAHRELINEDSEKISSKNIQSLTHKICKETHFNFGDTLQSWTYNTFVQENEKVMFEKSYYEFLDFFTQKEIIILKQALIFKKITEYGLKRVTSMSYDDYKSAIRRLINVKVLVRSVNGELYINPVVVNDITRIIKSKSQN